MTSELDAIYNLIGTSRLDTAAIRSSYDVVVIGAGPSGATAAFLLADGGCSVLLLDKAQFPRAKVCGCCLSTQAVFMIESLKRTHILNRLEAPFVKEFLVATGSKKISIPLPNGRVLSRAAFDASLVAEAITAGAHFADSSSARVEDSAVTQGAVCVRLAPHDDSSASPKQIHAKSVIVADGIGGTSLSSQDWRSDIYPSSRVGIATITSSSCEFYQGGVIYMAYAKQGYIGVVKLEDGDLNIAAAFDPAFIKQCGGPAESAIKVLQASNLPLPADLSESTWRGTVQLTRRRKAVASKRIFVIGDAASFVEPFTGEGIAWALSSATAVVPLVIQAVECWHDSLTEEWTRIYRTGIGKQQSATKIVTWLLRHPGLAGGVATIMNTVPGITKPLVSLVTACDQRDYIPFRERQKCERT